MERIPRNLIHFAEGHHQRYRWAQPDVTNSTSVLDAACGIGYGADILLAGAPGATYTGIDKDDCFHPDYAGSRRAFWQRDLNGPLPATTSKFSMAVSFETIEHLEDPERFIRWLCTVTAGPIWASVPVVPSKHSNEFHLHDFEPGDLEKLFAGFGWSMTDWIDQPAEVSEVCRFVEV